MIGTIAGAIFNNADRESIIAFHAAVDRVNSYQTKFELRPIFRNVTEWDSFVTEKIGMMPKLNMLSRLSSVIHKIPTYSSWVRCVYSGRQEEMERRRREGGGGVEEAFVDWTMVGYGYCALIGNKNSITDIDSFDFSYSNSIRSFIFI